MVEVCQHFKFGYFKFGDTCFKKHVKDICENDNCDKEQCELRHPKLCSYYNQFNYCKFRSYCCYSHEKRLIFSDKMVALEGIIQEKSLLIDKLNVKLECLEKKIDTIQNKTKNNHKNDNCNKTYKHSSHIYR